MKESTHQKLLDATRKLIWKQGVNKTTVDHICDEAGLSKMTFYRAYENKFDIFKEILDENYKDLGEAYERIFFYRKNHGTDLLQYGINKGD